MRKSDTIPFSKIIGEHLKRLSAASLPAAALEDPLPVCPLCQNHGWLVAVYPDGRQYKQPCSACAAGQAVLSRVMDNRYSEAKLPAMYRDFTFETWRKLPADQLKGKNLAEAAALEFARHPDGQVSSHALVQHLAQRFPMALEKYRDVLEKPEVLRHGFILSGLPGTGKTGLCAAAINHIIEHGGYVMYLRVLDALRALSSTWQDGGERELLNTFKTAPMLFMDDFGLDAQPRDHQREYMQIVIRYRAANRLPTLVTTNLNRDDFIREWGNQTTDVLFELCHWIDVIGAKLRNTDNTWEAF